MTTGDDDLIRVKLNIDTAIFLDDAAKRLAPDAEHAIAEPRNTAIEADATMIAGQMTMDLLAYALDDLIEGAELGGAAPYIEMAVRSDINRFIRRAAS